MSHRNRSAVLSAAAVRPVIAVPSVAVAALLTLASAGCDTKQEVPKSTANAIETTTNQPPSDTDRAVPTDLSLTLQNGKQVHLSDYRGKHLVLYFYPKDDTPGCRVEAQGFRSLHDQFVERGAVVLGVSTQDAESHQAFIAKEQLPFDLVVDTDGSVARAFDVPLMMGSLASRQTVLLDPQGRVSKRWEKVSPSEHASEVLAALK